MSNIYAGITIENGYPVFNWDEDNKASDILYLAKPQYGTELIAGIPVMYGYEYAKKHGFDEQKALRNYLKKNASTSLDVNQFVEYGVLHLNTMFDLSELGYAVHPDSKTGKDLINLIGDFLIDYSDAVLSDFELIKETFQNVTFDAEKAAEEMRKRGLPERTIQIRIKEAQSKLEICKQRVEPFEIKLFGPRSLRFGFMDYLKFGSEDEKLVYQSLQGVKVLIYDDVATSGATLKEMHRYLTAINPNNELYSFVLLRQ